MALWRCNLENLINLRHLISDVPVEFLRHLTGRAPPRQARGREGVPSWLSCKLTGGRTKGFSGLPALEDNNNNNRESDAFVLWSEQGEASGKEERVWGQNCNVRAVPDWGWAPCCRATLRPSQHPASPLNGPCNTWQRWVHGAWDPLPRSSVSWSSNHSSLQEYPPWPS